MATPANRAKIQLVRGTYANILASLSDLVDGELCYAKDENRLYMVEGSTLTEIQADPEDIEGLIASIIVGGTGLTATHDNNADTVTLDLDDTAVAPGNYGSATQIPTLTIDQQGRITAASLNTINTDLVLVEVHNQSGAQLDKGKPVYVAGTHSSGKPIVELADNDGTGTYPAIGLVSANIANGDDGKVAISGTLTNIDTSSYSAGDALYLDSTAGNLTATRPIASTSKVQKVGLVTRSHASNGSILIIGAGRTNDITNELVALTGVSLNNSNLGTFTGSTITDSSSIKTALQELETSLETLETGVSGDFTVGGNLTVSGTTTTIESVTLTVDDKNIELGSVATPTDATANGGGITLKGATDKTINWISGTGSWTFSENIDLAATKQVYLNGTMVLGYSGSDRVLDNVIIDGGTY